MNNTKLVHWLLIGGLLHLVLRGRAWAGFDRLWRRGQTTTDGCQSLRPNHGLSPGSVQWTSRLAWLPCRAWQAVVESPATWAVFWPGSNRQDLLSARPLRPPGNCSRDHTRRSHVCVTAIINACHSVSIDHAVCDGHEGITTNCIINQNIDHQQTSWMQITC